jgi:hypothetical protein
MRYTFCSYPLRGKGEAQYAQYLAYTVSLQDSSGTCKLCYTCYGTCCLKKEERSHPEAQTQIM